MTPTQKREAAAPIMDAFRSGFTAESGFTLEFWKPGGILFRRTAASDRYLLTRHPAQPTTIARVCPSTSRSTRVELHIPKRVLTRDRFRRECSDEQLALLRFSKSKGDVILTVGNDVEAVEAGRVLAKLHKQKAFA